MDSLLVQIQIAEVCYNAQAAVNEKHKLIRALHMINRNDSNAMNTQRGITITNIH
ncbi:hypothetical protein BH11BAC1_BH11BAC1_14450 [soil metagenome]